VGDEHDLRLSLLDVRRLTTRLDGGAVANEEEVIEGRLLGILPESRQFEFRRLSDETVFEGAASEGLATKYEADEAFRNRALAGPVLAFIRRTRTMRGERLLRERSTLEAVALPEHDASETIA
jgi:hypothetical protein